MQKLAGLLASIGIGALMTAAGLAFDVVQLAIAGIILLCAAAVLWLVGWGKRKPSPTIEERAPPPVVHDQSVTSHGQTGGITAHNVNKLDD